VTVALIKQVEPDDSTSAPLYVPVTFRVPHGLGPRGAWVAGGEVLIGQVGRAHRVAAGPETGGGQHSLAELRRCSGSDALFSVTLAVGQ